MVASLLTAWGCESGHPHWGYEGKAGPDHWAQLSADNAACGSGRSQSPIDIVAPEDVDLPPIDLQYNGRLTAITNNGHAVQLEVEPGNWLEIAGHRWALAQVHFHSPANITSAESVFRSKRTLCIGTTRAAWPWWRSCFGRASLTPSCPVLSRHCRGRAMPRGH
jgi:carbonic anhydrase